jgi:hypothetical protein
MKPTLLTNHKITQNPDKKKTQKTRKLRAGYTKTCIFAVHDHEPQLDT